MLAPMNDADILARMPAQVREAIEVCRVALMRLDVEDKAAVVAMLIASVWYERDHPELIERLQEKPQAPPSGPVRVAEKGFQRALYRPRARFQRFDDFDCLWARTSRSPRNRGFMSRISG
jgi:hypothetical protein